MPRIGGNRLIFVDPVVIALSVALSLLLAAGPDGGATPAAYLAAGVLPIVARPALNVRFGLYRRVWRHASIAEMVQIVMAATAGSLVCIACVLLLLPLTGTADPLALRSFWALEGLLSLAMVGGVRFAIRARAEGTGPSGHSRADGVPTILYGAGAGGVMVVRAARDPRSGIRPVGFLDDDSRLWGHTVAELPVGGDLDRLQDLVQETGAQRLLITINNAPGEAVRRIVREAAADGLDVRTVPPIHELFDGASMPTGFAASAGRPAPPAGSHRTRASRRDLIAGRSSSPARVDRSAPSLPDRSSPAARTSHPYRSRGEPAVQDPARAGAPWSARPRVGGGRGAPGERRESHAHEAPHRPDGTARHPARRRL